MENITGILGISNQRYKSEIKQEHPRENLRVSSEVTLCRDVYAGEARMKSPGKVNAYLPKTDRFLLQNGATVLEHDAYVAYISGATLINYYKRGVNHVIGSVFKKAPVLKSEDETLNQLFDSGGVGGKSYPSFISEVIREILIAGRCLVYCEYREAINFDGKINRMPILRRFRTEDIETIEMDTFGNIEDLTLRQIDIENQIVIWHFRKGRTATDNFTLNIEKENGDLIERMNTRWGSQYPPLILCGIDGILITVDPPQPPLLEVAQLCIALFREIAKRSYYTNQVITPFKVFIGHNEGIDEALDKSSGRSIALAPNSDVKIVETKGNYIEAINQTISQLSQAIRESLGQVGYEARIERETAEGVRNRYAGEYSFLCSVSNAVTSITRRVAQIIASLAGVEFEDIDVQIEFHKDFNREILSDQQISLAVEEFKIGLIPAEQLEAILRRKGWFRDDSGSTEMTDFLERARESLTAEQIAGEVQQENDQGEVVPARRRDRQ